MDEFILLALIVGFICGIIGMCIGMTVDRLGSGFFLGAFLGPIGWIIVLLLPRKAAEIQKEQNTAAEVKTEVITENRSRDLSDDSYKIYLGKKYKIERNELFAQFECNEKLFDSLDDALAYADGLESENQVELSEATKLQELIDKTPRYENLKEEFAKRGISLSMPLWSDGYTIKDSSGSQNMNWAELRRYWAKMILEEEKSDD